MCSLAMVSIPPGGGGGGGASLGNGSPRGGGEPSSLGGWTWGGGGGGGTTDAYQSTTVEPTGRSMHPYRSLGKKLEVLIHVKLAKKLL